MNGKQKKKLYRIAASAVMIIILKLMRLQGWQQLFMLIPYLTAGYDILIGAFKGVKNRQPFDENFLMAVATIGALTLGDFTEATAVMVFYQVGELFESIAVGKSRKSIAALMDIRPESANVEQPDGSVAETDPDQVPVGSVIVVRPGEKVPIDGVIIWGHTDLDTAALTGESMPRECGEGERVISGCVNLTGAIKVRTEKEFGESTVSRILELVENASSRKSRSENFISRFAAVYTPAVCFSALALLILPPVISLLSGGAPVWSTWLYRALTFLVISCPCALVISIPLSFFAGLGGASSAGVLIKGSNYLEALSYVDTVAFDKTGTVTRGVPEVVGVHHCPMEDKAVLEYAALAESYSTHPIGGSLLRAWGGEIDKSRVSDIQELSGRGIIARVDGRSVAVGNEKLMAELGVRHMDCDQVGTLVHVALDGVYMGHILICDTLKPGADEAIKNLRKAGVKTTVMLTGDGESVGQSVAKELGIDRVHCRLLPEDKVRIVEELLKDEKSKGKLAFVGDGINDAPVLTRADVGIAMGALGSDAAIEAADVVLMDDDPRKIAKAIAISRKCIRIVYENIVFALGVKLICLAMSALGIANMWWAIFADVGVMMIAVLNAVRALNVKKL